MSYFWKQKVVRVEHSFLDNNIEAAGLHNIICSREECIMASAVSFDMNKVTVVAL